MINRVPLGVKLTILLNCCQAESLCKAAAEEKEGRGEVIVIALSSEDGFAWDGLFYNYVVSHPLFRTSKGKKVQDVVESWQEAMRKGNYPVAEEDINLSGFDKVQDVVEM